MSAASVQPFTSFLVDVITTWNEFGCLCLLCVCVCVCFLLCFFFFLQCSICSCKPIPLSIITTLGGSPLKPSAPPLLALTGADGK